jgi:hypothetical protein
MARKTVLDTITHPHPRIAPLSGHHAEIVPGVSIRLYGEDWRVMYENGVRCDRLVPYDVTFKVGDEAEHGSYNLRYTGKIVGIGVKTVTIDASDIGHTTRRLTIHEFDRRNYKFDAAKVAEFNADEMMHI